LGCCPRVRGARTGGDRPPCRPSHRRRRRRPAAAPIHSPIQDLPSPTLPVGGEGRTVVWCPAGPPHPTDLHEGTSVKSLPRGSASCTFLFFTMTRNYAALGLPVWGSRYARLSKTAVGQGSPLNRGRNSGGITAAMPRHSIPLLHLMRTTPLVCFCFRGVQPQVFCEPQTVNYRQSQAF